MDPLKKLMPPARPRAKMPAPPAWRGSPTRVRNSLSSTTSI